jgi:hypothetical protein
VKEVLSPCNHRRRAALDMISFTYMRSEADLTPYVLTNGVSL